MTALQDINPDHFPIHARDGLPEPLRILLQDYPRDLWTKAEGFDQVIRVWLKQHLGFRRALAGLGDIARDGMARSVSGARLAAMVSRQANTLVSDLRTHNAVEDSHYFPALRSREPRIARGFDILAADHVALETRLHAFVTSSDATVTALDHGADTLEPCASLKTALDGLSGVLHRHLLDEEDLIVPVLLRFGTRDLI